MVLCIAGTLCARGERAVHGAWDTVREERTDGESGSNDLFAAEAAESMKTACRLQPVGRGLFWYRLAQRVWILFYGWVC